MSNLENKTLFVSGASRGIGLAIAKRAAKDGANVILAAKTAEPHPKLPGTIYTAADEIEAKTTDGTDIEPETVEVDGRKPEDPPQDEVVDTAPASMDPPEATAEQPPEEETKDETDS